jgi:tetratricopeptide (TPR) repeat protein
VRVGKALTTWAILTALLLSASPTLAQQVPASESVRLQTAATHLTKARTPQAIVDVLEIARLFGALPPAVILRAVLPAAERWLTDKKLAHTAVAGTLRSLVVQAAEFAGDDAILKKYADPRGVVTQWSWLGPFGDEHGSAFARTGICEREPGVASKPEQGVPGRNGIVHWRVVPEGLVRPGARVPFEELVDRADDAILYVQAWIKPQKPGPALLHLGVDGPVRAWLGGEPVLQLDPKPELYGIEDACPVLPEVDAAAVTLQPGWQRLLVKLAPSGPRLPLSASLTDLHGEPIALEVRALAPPEPVTPAAQGEPGPCPTPELLPDGAAGLRWPETGKTKGPSPLPGLIALAWHGWPLAPALGERLLAAVPEDLPAEPQTALGHAMLAGELGDRIDRLRQWSALLPDSAELLVAQAQALDQMGKTAQAQRLWQDWIERTGRHPEDEGIRACIARVDLWTRLGADLAATTLLRTCGGRWPESPELLQARVRDALAHDRLAEVVKLQGELVKLEPGRLERHMAHLQALADLGRVADVLTEAAEITQRFPQRSRAFEVAAQLLLAEGHPKQAQAAVLRVPGPLQRAATLELRGRIAARLGQRDEALTQLRAAVEQSPARPDLRARLQLLRPDGDFFAWHRRDLLAMVKKEARQTRREPLEMRLRQTVLQVVGNGQQARYDAEVYYVGPGGEATHEVTIEYAPTLSRAEVLQAAVVHADGRIERNASQEVDSIGDDESGMYYDLERITLGFKGLKNGDAIVVEYAVRDLAPTPFGLVFGELMQLGETFAVRETDVVVQLPQGTPFHYDVEDPSKDVQEKVEMVHRSLPPSGTDRDDAGPWDEWRLQLGPLPGTDPEERMPGTTDVVPYLHMSSFANWTDAARWYAGLMKEALPVRGSDPVLRDLALRLTQGLTTPQQKARALYSYAAAQVRYVGLEFGIHSLKPHAAREVMQRQFGDCKDKATLLVALLAEVGIEAQVALVRTVDEGRLHDGVASLGVFNHAIAYIPSLDWWLDATAQHHSPLELPGQDAGGMTLRIPRVPEEARLERLPDAPASAHARDEIDQFTVQADGSALLDLTLKLCGLPAAEVRSRLDTAQARKERLEQDLAPRLPGVSVTDVTVTGIEPPADEVVVHVQARVPQWAQVRGTGLVVAALRPPSSYVQGLASQATRTQEVVLDHAFDETTLVRVMPPPGLTIGKLPGTQQIDGPSGTFTRTARMLPGGGAELTTRIQLQTRRISPKQYAAFRGWLTQVDASLRAELAMSPVEVSP